MKTWVVVLLAALGILSSYAVYQFAKSRDRQLQPPPPPVPQEVSDAGVPVQATPCDGTVPFGGLRWDVENAGWQRATCGCAPITPPTVTCEFRNDADDLSVTITFAQVAKGENADAGFPTDTWVKRDTIEDIVDDKIVYNRRRSTIHEPFGNSVVLFVGFWPHARREEAWTLFEAFETSVMP